MTLKDTKFLNGTIEYDIFLKETPAFPGVYFRVNGRNGEQFYVRPHQSGNPDANQAAPVVNGISPWQLYFGPKYSFPYKYKYDNWTHVKIVVNNDKAQVYLDYSEKPNLSWNLFHEPAAGDIVIRGGGAEAMHIADIKIDMNAFQLVDFSPGVREPIEGAIAEWEISDMFEEKELEDPTKLEPVINARKWGRKIQLEEGGWRLTSPANSNYSVRGREIPSLLRSSSTPRVIKSSFSILATAIGWLLFSTVKPSTGETINGGQGITDIWEQSGCLTLFISI